MDVQVKELIEKIKNDGVKNAEESSSRIISEAKKQEAAIIEKAKKEAAEIKAQAQSEASRYEQAGKEALKQAGRDLLLSFRKEIETLFDGIIKAETQEALKGDNLKKCIVTVLEHWKGDDISDLSVLVNEDTLKGMEKDLTSALAAEIKKGLEVKPFKDIDAGFRVSVKDGQAFYDFSDEELVQLLAKYLNPGLLELLK